MNRWTLIVAAMLVAAWAYPAMAADGPATTMPEMSQCPAAPACSAKLADMAKALDAARAAAQAGDAKAALVEIDKAAKLVADMQAMMKPAQAAATAGPAAPVNAKCPITGGPVSKAPGSVSRQYKGKTVGFCCSDCPAVWDKLSDADKDKKLAEAMKP